jgi:Ca2+-binding RTX toxin-like protein
MVIPISRIPALVLLAVSAWAATLAVPDPASAARVFIGVRDAVVFVARPGEANRVGVARLPGAPDRVLLGGPGPDRFQGGAGDDLAKGETGSDRLVEIGTGTGKDRLFGGPGIDGAIFVCSRCTVNLDDSAAAGSAERPDDVRAEIVRTPGGYFDQTEEEAVPFPPGEDRVTGNGEANILETGFGRDLVKGGGGKDILHAGRGPDRVLARDGERDRVACGAGTDTAIVDAADVTSGCEEAETA